ncbi:uncharacterized protein LOC100373959 [Saccoglossus kowalevskii]|uniref:Uncharacterized protein LOC100373959 n=1 Tax=Saccoglossus kowalevskii TaxID=10224 RepID=A0ABM0GN76_SACKO|nr:PREDICTED: uncharacterized protein LOC100373959 [Saccoglossus kowalevskii]
MASTNEAYIEAPDEQVTGAMDPSTGTVVPTEAAACAAPVVEPTGPPPAYDPGNYTYDIQKFTNSNPEKPPLPDDSPYPQQPVAVHIDPTQQYAMYVPGAYDNTDSTMPAYPHNMTMIRESEQTTKPTSGRDIGALIFSIFACLCFFWPVGIAAIVYSAMALSYRGKQGYDNRADQYVKYSLILSSLAIFIGSILLVVFVIVED